MHELDTKHSDEQQKLKSVIIALHEILVRVLTKNPIELKKTIKLFVWSIQPSTKNISFCGNITIWMERNNLVSIAKL